MWKACRNCKPPISTRMVLRRTRRPYFRIFLAPPRRLIARTRRYTSCRCEKVGQRVGGREEGVNLGSRCVRTGDKMPQPGLHPLSLLQQRERQALKKNSVERSP